MSRPYPHALPVGTRLESYEVRTVLGVGGFGITYRAYDHDLERDVAVKEYLPAMFAVRDPDGTTVTPKSGDDAESYEYGLRRFLDEARTLARFHQPNIVRVLRFLEAHHTAYFVMDYEEGEPLHVRLKREGRLSESSIRDMGVPILRSLRVVHAEKFLHRDIKPANIYLRHDRSPVLLDFGSARRALEEHARNLTGVVTPGYAPIEQYLPNERQGPWTDLYSLGATLFHCATGIAPVGATERIAARNAREPDPFDSQRASLASRFSASLFEALQWMLALNAADRPQSVDQVLPLFEHGQSAVRTGTHPALESVTDEEHVWRPDVLKAMEESLEPHVGPMSRALVRKAARRATSIEALTDLVAQLLPDERERTEFIARTRRIVPVPVPVAGAATDTPSVRRSKPVLPLDEALVTRAERLLAAHIGPMARVIVRKTAQRTSDPAEFHRLLAAELDGEAQRSTFLAAIAVATASRP
jgi:serine/threonine protein kinase